MVHVPAPPMATLVTPCNEVDTEQAAVDANVTGWLEPPPATVTVNGASPYVFIGLVQLGGEERPVMLIVCAALTVEIVTVRSAGKYKLLPSRCALRMQS